MNKIFDDIEDLVRNGNTQTLAKALIGIIDNKSSEQSISTDEYLGGEIERRVSDTDLGVDYDAGTEKRHDAGTEKRHDAGTEIQVGDRRMLIESVETGNFYPQTTQNDDTALYYKLIKAVRAEELSEAVRKDSKRYDARFTLLE